MIQPWDKVLVKIVAFDGKHKLSNKWGENSFNVQSLSNKDISVYTVRKEYPDELCIDIFHYRKDRNTALHNMKILTQITAGIRWWWMKQYPLGKAMIVHLFRFKDWKRVIITWTFIGQWRRCWRWRRYQYTFTW